MAKNNADVQIASVLEMSNRMLVVSEEGFRSCDDDGCLLLNGLVRECAYRLRDAAERERQVHGTQGNRGARHHQRSAVVKKVG